MTAFSVDATDASRPPRVLVDGVEVEGVAGASVTAEFGHVARLRLLLVQGATFSGDGVVEVAQDGDQREAVVAWLARIDPDQLSKTVLERMGPGSGNAAAETLAALRSLAGDVPPPAVDACAPTCLICDQPVERTAAGLVHVHGEDASEHSAVAS